MAELNIKQYVRDSIKTYLSIFKPDIDGKEESLGNPATDGYILSSLIDGTRSWVANAGGVSALNDLSDVDTTGVANNHVLKYNDANNRFESVPLSGGGDAMLSGGNSFSGVQKTGIDTTTAANVIDFGTENNFVFTATSANVTATNMNIGQSGVIVIQSAENVTGWGVEFKFKTVPTSLVGDETFGYFIQSATVIRIGRMD